MTAKMQLKTQLKTQLQAVACTAVLLASPMALASSVKHTYTFNNNPDKVISTSGAPSMGVSAWYGTSNTDKVLDEAHSWNIYSGGAGIYNENTNDQHTIDNKTHNNYTTQCYWWWCWQTETPSNAIYDYLALSFDDLVSLAHVNIGYVGGGHWSNRDSDFSVFYSDNPAYDFAGDTANGDLSLTAGGFKLATHVNGGSSAASYDISAATKDIESSVWIVAAYSPVLGWGNNHVNTGNDEFKLASISVHTTDDKNGGSNGGGNGGNVPVPATAALLGLGGLLLRRRRSASA